MIEASNTPAVPGAKGEKPEPKPVPINTGRKGDSSLNYKLLIKKRVEVEHPPPNDVFSSKRQTSISTLLFLVPD